MRNNFELNPLDKINKIQNDLVKQICTIAIIESQNNIHQSKDIAVKRVATEISQQLPSIAKEYVNEI